VFVPIAHRLGMWFFKTELEELCFATMQPQVFVVPILDRVIPFLDRASLFLDKHPLFFDREILF